MGFHRVPKTGSQAILLHCPHSMEDTIIKNPLRFGIDAAVCLCHAIG
jgi:hypothetical protein